MVKSKDRKALRNKNIYRLIFILIAVIAINILAGFVFFRIDLTSEKRYTLTDATKEILTGLDDIIYFRVYLDGELPADMIRFKRKIKEMLDEFRAYGGSRIEYQFINIYEEENEKIRNEQMKELASKGLNITDIKLRDKEGALTSKLIIPGALVSYKGIEFPVNLLKNNPGLPYRQNLNNSIQSLEYEFIKSIKSLTAEKIEKIAFIQGHNELDFYQTMDIGKELSLFFDVRWTEINGNLDTLRKYKAIIIAQPLESFPEKDRFVLDQYIMRGGRALFFLDPVQTNADSLVSGRTFTFFQDLNLYELLFKYGIRVQYNLIKDLQCNVIRVETSIQGQEPRTVTLPWWYYPLLTAPNDHFLTKGLNYIKTEFVSALDTTASPPDGVERTVLLSSSDSSALIRNPISISMDEITRPPERRLYTNSNLPVAILMEGQFPSFYSNYGVPEGAMPENIEIKDKSEPAMIFVAGDGDMIRNEVRISSGKPVPLKLGYDPDTRQTFGNKEFIMNVINYMTDDYSLIEMRAREFKLRLLDNAKIRLKKQKIKWQLINLILPVILIVSGGLIFNYRRKKYYGT